VTASCDASSLCIGLGGDVDSSRFEPQYELSTPCASFSTGIGELIESPIATQAERFSRHAPMHSIRDSRGIQSKIVQHARRERPRAAPDMLPTRFSRPSAPTRSNGLLGRSRGLAAAPESTADHYWDMHRPRAPGRSVSLDHQPSIRGRRRLAPAKTSYFGRLS